MSTIKNDALYEWVKGDYVGIIEKVTSEVNENNIEWINFESGRRINKNLFVEFLLISETGKTSIDIRSTPPAFKTESTPPAFKTEEKREEKRESAISILLKSQRKKRKETLKIEFELELPPPEILNIMYDSFGDDLITEIYKMNVNNLEEILPAKFEEAIKFHLNIK